MAPFSEGGRIAQSMKSSTDRRPVEAVELAKQSLSLEEWPPLDRAKWVQAFRRAPTSPTRPDPANWSRETVVSAIYGYGRWLSFLAAFDPSALSERPSSRVTPARLAGFVDFYLAKRQPVTLRIHLSVLRRTLRAMYPGSDTSLIQATRRRVPLPPSPSETRRDRVARLADADFAGLLHRLASPHPTFLGALQFRDALAISLMLRRALRLRTATMLDTTDVFFRAGGAVIHLRSKVVKNRRAKAVEIPKRESEYLRNYISSWRPMLTPSPDGPLWVSGRGGRLSKIGLQCAVRHRLRGWFDIDASSRDLRRYAVSKLVDQKPGELRAAQELLGHGRLAMSERFYIVKPKTRPMTFNKEIERLRRSLGQDEASS